MSEWSCSIYPKKTPLKRKGRIAETIKRLQRDEQFPIFNLYHLGNIAKHPVGVGIAAGIFAYEQAKRRKSKELKRIERLL